MRVALVGILIVASGLGVAAQAPAVPQGRFQSSADNRVYELRARGELGLDVYTTDGRIVAVMDRANTREQFKGETTRLATRCPKDTGKIETVSLDADRIRIRVETPSQSIATKEQTCGAVVIGRRPWAELHFIREGTSAQSSALSSDLSASGSGISPVAESIRFALTEAKASGSTLTMRWTLTNEGDDRVVIVCQGKESGGRCGGSGVSMIDDMGNSHVVTRVTVGNQPRSSVLVNGVPTVMTLEFTNLPTRGGVLQASGISRILLRTYVHHEGRWGNGKLATVELTNQSIAK